MKQILSIVIVLLLAKSIYAQDMLIDTTVAAKQDTISISDMVNKQIEIARLKKGYTVEGVGQKKGFVTTFNKNTK